MSDQHNGWGGEHPKYFNCHVPNQMNNGFPISCQSSRGADNVNTAPPTPAPNLWWPVPSCSSVDHNRQSKHFGKYGRQVEQTIQPVLTTIVPNSNLAIPVLSSVRRERSAFPNEKKVKEVEWNEKEVECNNNIKGEESTEPALLFCSMCVGKTLLGEEALRRHLKIHYEAMFKCGVCRRGFEKLSEAVQHHGRKHAGQGDTEVVWPPVSRLLSARCKLRGCKRELVGVTGTEVEEHLKAVHDQGGKKASKKRKQAVEWRCRVCHNSGRRLGGEIAALAHVRAHCPGEEECDASDTTSGGFSSASSCEEHDLVDPMESDGETDADAAEDFGGSRIATSNLSVDQAGDGGGADEERAQACEVGGVAGAVAGSNANMLHKSE